MLPTGKTTFSFSTPPQQLLTCGGLQGVQSVSCQHISLSKRNNVVREVALLQFRALCNRDSERRHRALGGDSRFSCQRRGRTSHRDFNGRGKQLAV